MMEEKEIFRKVGEIINELTEQYKYLSNNKDNINELEIELFVANANFLADHIKIIQKLNNAKKPALETIPKLSVKETGNFQEQVAEKPDKSESSDANVQEGRSTDAELEVDKEVAEKKTVKEEKSGEIKFDFSSNDYKADEVEIVENEKDRDHLVAEEETIIQNVVIPERTVSIDTPKQTATPQTVNEKLSETTGQATVGGNYNRQPVTDLKSIINLNDKLLFVKDLFNGYSLAYSEAIELVNRFDNFEAADNFLKKNYALKNNWSDKQDTVDKFYGILNRRFSK